METESITLRLSSLSTDIEVNSIDFQKELKSLLEEKSFLNDGGILGFGLGYKYNWSETDGYISSSGINGLYNMLKPADKLLYSIGLAFKLKPKLKIVYKFESYRGVSLLSTNLSPFPGGPQLYGPTWKNMGGLNTLREQISGEIIELSDNWDRGGLDTGVNWLKPVKYVNNKSEYIEQVLARQNISSVSRSYVLTMSVPKFLER